MNNQVGEERTAGTDLFLERVVQDRLRAELMGRAIGTGLTNALLCCVLVLVAKLYVIKVPGVLQSIIFILSANAVRSLTGYLFKDAEGISRRRLLARFYVAATFCAGAGWAALTVLVIANYGPFHKITSLTFLAFAGITTNAVMALGAWLWMSRTYIGIMVLPPLAFLLFGSGEEGASALASVITVGWTYYFYQCGVYSRYLKRTFTGFEEMARNRDFLQTVFDTIPGYISCVDSDMKYRAANQQLRAVRADVPILGQPIGLVEDQRWMSLISDFMTSENQSATVETELDLNGMKRWCLLSMSKTQTPPGGAVFVAIDIHDKKVSELNAKRHRAAAENAARMAALGEMAGGVAHEINNPLSIIKARAEQVRMRVREGNVDPGVIIQIMEKIDAHATRIAKIVRGMMAVSRNAAADPLVPTALTSVVEDVLELSRERFTKSGINLRVEMVPDVLIQCRPAQMGQVLLNLLNNAHDAVQRLQTKWVEITFRQTGQEIEIIVCDSGHGIPPDIADKIMQPFFTTKEVGKGTGLGLSISMNIVHEHGGTLQLDTKAKNTTFIIRLPAQSTAETSVTA